MILTKLGQHVNVLWSVPVGGVVLTVVPHGGRERAKLQQRPIANGGDITPFNMALSMTSSELEKDITGNIHFNCIHYLHIDVKNKCGQIQLMCSFDCFLFFSVQIS